MSTPASSLPGTIPGGFPSSNGPPYQRGATKVSAVVNAIAWQPFTEYVANQLVTNAGSTYIANFDHVSAASFSADAIFWTVIGGVADVSPGPLLGIVWLQDYGADNTGTVFSDAAFAAAIAKAQTYLQYGQSGHVLITGLSGVYKLGQYVSLLVPSGVAFGGFGGRRAAQFNFAALANQPTVSGTVIAASAGQVTVGSIKQNWPGPSGSPLSFPVPGSVPQTIFIYGSPCTYSGITGNGTATVTLTGVVGMIGSPSGYVGGPVLAGPAILLSGTGVSGNWQLDDTIEVFGPGNGYVAYGSTTTGSVTPGTTTTVPMTSTTGLPAGGAQLMLVGSSNCYVFSYAGISGLNLTGVTWLTSGGAVGSGASVFNITPPNTTDGVYMGHSRGAIDCAVNYFRFASVMMGDHEQWGPNFLPSGCMSAVRVEAPNSSFVAFDSGNQTFHPGIDWHGLAWSPIHISAFNELLSPTWYGGNTMGFSPWAFCWKEATAGVASSVAGIMGSAIVRDASFEGPGLGIVGCPDLFSQAGIMFDNCSLLWDAGSSESPGGLPPIAEFACNMSSFHVVGGSMFNGPSTAPNTPYFFGYEAIGEINAPLVSVIGFLTTRAKIGIFTNGDGSGKAKFAVRFPGGIITAIYPSVTVAAGMLIMNGGLAQAGVLTVPFGEPDPGASPLLGVIAGSVAGAGAAGWIIAAIAQSQDFGPVNVAVHTGGDITANSFVQSNGATSPGTAKSGQNGVVFGFATAADSGGFAPIILTSGIGSTGPTGATGGTGPTGPAGPAPTTVTATQQSGTGSSAYTFALTDAGTVVEATGATAATFTIPPHSSVAWVTGTIIEVFQDGAGQVTIAAGAGVTLRSDGSKVNTAAQYATIGLRCRATDEWVLSGDLA